MTSARRHGKWIFASWFAKKKEKEKKPPLKLDINELGATEGKTDCGRQGFFFFLSRRSICLPFVFSGPTCCCESAASRGVPPVLNRPTSGRRQAVGTQAPSKSAAARPRSQSSLTRRSEGHDLDMCSRGLQTMTPTGKERKGQQLHRETMSVNKSCCCI